MGRLVQRLAVPIRRQEEEVLVSRPLVLPLLRAREEVLAVPVVLLRMEDMQVQDSVHRRRLRRLALVHPTLVVPVVPVMVAALGAVRRHRYQHPIRINLLAPLPRPRPTFNPRLLLRLFPIPLEQYRPLQRRL